MTHPLRMRICLPVLAAAFAASLATPISPAAAAERFVPAQVIVRYDPGSSTAERAEARQQAGTKTIEGVGLARTQLLKVTDGDSVAATVRQLEAQPGVAYAEPNGISQPASLPDDARFYPDQWALYNDGQTVGGVTGTPGADIKAPAAWNLTTGIAPGLPNSPVIAVMDTGADLQHTDLSGELWTNPGETPGNGTDDDGNGYADDVHGWDFIGDSYSGGATSPDSNPSDMSGHGTHVSGIAAAQGDNGVGVTGVSQHASLMELRVCGTFNSGCPNSALIEAMNYAANNGARVVNGSIAGGCASQLISDTLNSHPSTLYVFAAGNGNYCGSTGNGSGVNDDVNTNYPCTADQAPGYTANNVICVAATTQSDGLASFSNYGASTVDLGAPGVNILSTSSQKAYFSDDFESGDISSSWTDDPGSTWAASTETPHNGSYGITDSPGGNYAPSTTNTVTSNAVTLPPLSSGRGSCEVDYFRSVDLGSGPYTNNDPSGSDKFAVQVLLAGYAQPKAVGYPQNHTSRNASVSLTDSAFDAGGQVQVQLQLTSNGSGEADGVHMDDIRLVCHGSPSDNGYELLDGTSMATPMVSGAAGLLFASDPSASASDVKNALLSSVDQLPALAGKTVSGGRLDVYAALGALAQGGSTPAGNGGNGGGSDGGNGPGPGSGGTVGRPNTFFRYKPGRVVRTARPKARVVFKFGSSQVGSSFRCALDSGAYRSCGRRLVRRLAPGRHLLKVKAVSLDGLSDPTAATVRFRVERLG